MKLFMCSVFDVKVGAYMTPFFVRSRGEALRSFEDACLDERHAFHKHGGDYVLYVLAEFDDSTGSVSDVEVAPLCTGGDFMVSRSLPAGVVSGANGSPLSSS